MVFSIKFIFGIHLKLLIALLQRFCQDLSNDYAAIEPPVWASLIANYLTARNYNVKILDAEAENLSHEETAEEIVKLNPFNFNRL